MSMQSVAMRAMMRASADDERYAGSAFTAKTLRRILAFALPRHKLLTGFLVLSLLTAVMAVATPLLAGRIVDEIVNGGSERTVITLAIIIGAIGIVEAIVAVATRVLSAHIGEGLILDLRRAVFTHVQTMSVAFFSRTRTGALVSRLNNDVIGAQRAFSDTLSTVVANAVQLTLTLIVMAQLSWKITVLSVLLLPIFLIPARMVGSKLARLRREAADINASMSDQMTERFNAGGATLVKLFGDARIEEKEFTDRAARVKTIGVRTAFNMSVFLNTLTLVSVLALALVYGFGGYYALAGDLNAGDIVALALLLTRLYGPLTALANARVEIMSALVSFERVFEVLDLTPMVTQVDNPTSLPAGPKGVRCENLTFAYPTAAEVSLASLEDLVQLDDRPSETVLHDVSFEVKPGKMLAIVGTSGAGKSTLAALVARLYDPIEGHIEVGGVDIRQAHMTDLQKAVSMVTQDGHLFHDTVANNLRFAAPDATDEQLWQALERARLTEVVRKLPDGLHTVVGDRGHRLSGGEKQRLTIARLLLSEPDIVILDEATAHLDSTSEVHVQQALEETLSDRTAIVIAHRLSTVLAADEIIVMEHGQIIERGTHATLLHGNGKYAELYHTQFKAQS